MSIPVVSPLTSGIATGTPTGSLFLRDDMSWQTPTASVGPDIFITGGLFCGPSFQASYQYNSSSGYVELSANSTSLRLKCSSGGNDITVYYGGGVGINGATDPGSGNTAVAGNLVLQSSLTKMGYGRGGTFSQSTSKVTSVSANTFAGLITMNAAALAANTTVSFTVTLTGAASDDYVMAQHVSGGTAGSYFVKASPGANQFVVTVRNITAGSLSEAVVIQFMVLKSSTT